MLITKKTKLSECSIFLTEEILNVISEKVPDEYLSRYDSILKGSIGDFIRLMTGDQDFFKQYFFNENKDVTVYEYAAKLKHLKQEIDKIINYLNSLSVKQAPEEIQAAKGVAFPKFAESMLVYSQQKFFLRSFKEAEEISLSEFILHKKTDLANQNYERNLRMINDRKQKQKSKK
jgi:hypothetical protein